MASESDLRTFTCYAFPIIYTLKLEASDILRYFIVRLLMFIRLVSGLLWE
jgi:hypothetical protein